MEPEPGAPRSDSRPSALQLRSVEPTRSTVYAQLSLMIAQTHARVGFLAMALLLFSPCAIHAQFKFPPPPRAPKNPALSKTIMAAKSVYFDNETGDSAVGRD